MRNILTNFASGCILALITLQGCDSGGSPSTATGPNSSDRSLVAARTITPMPTIEPLPSSVYSETNKQPAFHVNTTIFRAYAENQAKLFAQKQLEDYVNGLSSGTRELLREYTVKSVTLDLATGRTSALVYVRIGKQAGVMWDYGINATINLQLIQKEDYSDFGFLFESVSAGTTDGKLDALVDALFSPSGMAAWLSNKYSSTRYWGRSGVQSKTDPYVVADAEQKNMMNTLMAEGGPLAGFSNPISGSFTYQGATVAGTIRTSVYCTGFDLSTGIAKFYVRPTLYLTVNNAQKQVMMGNFELTLDLYAQPVKDHYGEIMSKITWRFYPVGVGCAIVGGTSPTPIQGLPTSYCHDPKLGSDFTSIEQAYWSNPWAYFGNTSVVNFWIKVSALTIRGTPSGDAGYQQAVLDKMIKAYSVNYAAKVSGISF